VQGPRDGKGPLTSVNASSQICVSVDPGLEQLNGTLPARIRTTLGHLRDVLAIPGVELRFHNVHLYNAIYRFDDEMIVTPYLYRAHGFQHPAFRLRRLGPYGVFASFADQFETIWAAATPAQNLISLANQPGA